MGREEKIVERISGYLKYSKKIIDVGAGRGIVASLLRGEDKIVAPVDVVEYRWGRSIPDVVLYDGKKLTFPDKSFDTGLLLMVLHHTLDPAVVFSEVARVSKEIIVIETTYRSLFEKIYTVLIDTLANLHLRFYWNSYRTDQEWRKFFKEAGFEVVSSQLHSDQVLGVPFLHAVYFLRARGSGIFNFA